MHLLYREPTQRVHVRTIVLSTLAEFLAPALAFVWSNKRNTDCNYPEIWLPIQLLSQRAATFYVWLKHHWFVFQSVSPILGHTVIGVVWPRGHGNWHRPGNNPWRGRNCNVEKDFKTGIVLDGKVNLNCQWAGLSWAFLL